MNSRHPPLSQRYLRKRQEKQIQGGSDGIEFCMDWFMALNVSGVRQGSRGASARPST